MSTVKTTEMCEKEAEELPVEVKKLFWSAMTVQGKNLGQAREIAGIDDIMVAAQLFIQCHHQISITKTLKEIGNE